jgi:hypothetical protein
MTKSAELAQQFQEIANRLKEAAVWNGSIAAVDAEVDSYVYELLCYFRVALAAKLAFKLKISGEVAIDRKGVSTALWPRGPALKKNFSYIALTPISKSATSFQLCPGIEIEDKHGKGRSPDINLLSHDAPDSPGWKSLHGCWDAKYTKNSKKRLPDTAISDFSYTYQHLGSPIMPHSWSSSVVQQKEFQKSGVLTNGLQSTERDSALIETGISETAGFPLNSQTRP